MGLMNSLLGRTRWYQALAWAHEEKMKRDAAHPARHQLRHIGPNSVLHPRVFVTHPGRVHIGDWSTIYNDTIIHSQGGCHIGNYVGIGYGSTVVTFNHNYRHADAIPCDNKFFLQPVIIRDYVWTGFHVRILPGIEIGEGAIVGMGSVVTKNVPPLAIVLGNPAVVVGRRSEEHFERCRAEGKVVPLRIAEWYQGKIIEAIPAMTKRRYAAELRDLGLLEQE